MVETYAEQKRERARVILWPQKTIDFRPLSLAGKESAGRFYFRQRAVAAASAVLDALLFALSLVSLCMHAPCSRVCSISLVGLLRRLFVVSETMVREAARILFIFTRHPTVHFDALGYSVAPSEWRNDVSEGLTSFVGFAVSFSSFLFLCFSARRVEI